jgi:hypothetical protein
MKRHLFAVLATFAALTTQTAAQSVAGEWDAAFNTPGGMRTFQLVFQVEGEQVTGTVKRQAGEVSLVGTVKGDTLSFSYTILYNENPLVLTITAKVRGDSLTGVVDFGGAAQEAFWAKRRVKLNLSAAQAASDRDGVRLAVLDYVEGFYEGDTTRLVRSVWPEMPFARPSGGQTTSFWRRRGDAG